MKAFVLVVGVLTSVSLNLSAQAAEEEIPSGYEEILQWLPEDTETLFVKRGPYLLMPAEADRKTSLDDLQFKLRILALGNLLAEEALWKNPIELSVEGSRRFRAPTHLGMMPYEGAEVIRFRDDLGPIMASLEKKALRIEEIGGKRVAVFEAKVMFDRWTTYVTQLGPKVMVEATNRAYLKELLGRMAKKGSSRALPAELTEWKHADTSAAFWGIRHYDRSGAAGDPSSPLAGRKMPANVQDDQAVGVVMALRDDGLKVQYLSANPDALRIAGDAWFAGGNQGPIPEVRTAEPGVIDVSFGLENDSPTQGMLLLLLLQALGHGVYF